jgi:hypothetical protein
MIGICGSMMVLRFSLIGASNGSSLLRKKNLIINTKFSVLYRKWSKAFGMSNICQKSINFANNK